MNNPNCIPSQCLACHTMMWILMMLTPKWIPQAMTVTHINSQFMSIQKANYQSRRIISFCHLILIKRVKRMQHIRVIFVPISLSNLSYLSYEILVLIKPLHLDGHFDFPTAKGSRIISNKHREEVKNYCCNLLITN